MHNMETSGVFVGYSAGAGFVSADTVFTPFITCQRVCGLALRECLVKHFCVREFGDHLPKHCMDAYRRCLGECSKTFGVS